MRHTDTKPLAALVETVCDTAAACAPDDGPALASIMSRLAVGLWCRLGGTPAEYVAMSASHARIHAQTQTREAAAELRQLHEHIEMLEQTNREQAAQLEGKVLHEQSADLTGFMGAVSHDAAQAREQKEAAAESKCGCCAVVSTVLVSGVVRCIVCGCER